MKSSVSSTTFTSCSHPWLSASDLRTVRLLETSFIAPLNSMSSCHAGVLSTVDVSKVFHSIA